MKKDELTLATKETLVVVKNFISTLPGNRKISLTDLDAHMSHTSIEKFKSFLMTIPDVDAQMIWKKLKKEITNKIILEYDEKPDIEAIQKFHVDPIELTRAFLNSCAISRPDFNAYATPFSLIELRDAEIFVNILKVMDRAYAWEMVDKLKLQAILVIARPEIEAFKEAQGIECFEANLRQGLDFGFPFLDWLLNHHQDKFMQVKDFVCENSRSRQDFSEMATLFNEWNERNAASERDFLGLDAIIPLDEEELEIDDSILKEDLSVEFENHIDIVEIDNSEEAEERDE